MPERQPIRPPASPVLLALLAAACAPAGTTPPPVAPPPPAVEEGPPAVEPDPIPAGRAAPAGTYDHPFDVLSYDLEIAVSDTARWIRGRARLEVQLTGAPEGPLGLDFTGLAVDRVTVDGSVVEARHRAGRLFVPVGNADPADGPLSVEILYGGVPDDGLILGRNVHGDPSAFVDNWPNRARFWFPSVDHPADKATLSLTVHAPGGWEVVSNGLLVEPPTPTPAVVPGPGATGPRRSWRWEQDVPISTYNMVFGGARMAVDTVGLAACGSAPESPREDGCIAVTTWLFPESVESGSPSFARADAMVDHMTDLFGPFPYAKLAHVQSSTRFGGMENASAIFYSEQALAAGRDIEGTVSHEVAHQWFGDGVTEADWRHLWLSEGFATYFGNQFFEAADGVEVFRDRMESARQGYLRSGVVDRPIVDPDVQDLFSLLNANNYQKGGWVLHMLRGVLGDEAFFRGVREYYERFANSTALTDDFRQVMEEASGVDLGWFFDQWVRSPGHPVLRATAEGTGAGARIRIEQLQDSAWPTFRFPLTVELHAGGETVRREILVDERVEILDSGLELRPDRIVLDPDGWLLGRVVEPGDGGR